MKVQKLIIGLVLIAVGASIVWYGFNLNSEDTEPTNTEAQETSESTPQVEMINRQGSGGGLQGDASNITCTEDNIVGDLADVSGGVGNGSANACYTDMDEFYMLASISNVPATSDGYFYEGWLVDRSNGNFISTGVAVVDEKSEGLEVVSLTNKFLTQEKDYSDYNYYVLTLEPDDGDPVPAEHIVEGELN